MSDVPPHRVWQETNLKRIEFRRFGEPLDELHLVDDEAPEPDPGQVRIRVEAAPINPSDLLAVRGAYGRLPELPAVPGNEGVGRVVDIGDGVTGVAPDHLVLLPPGSGTWRSAMTIDAHGLFPLPTEVDPLQLAMLYINPMTAHALLADIVELMPGDWVVVNAANSAVGHYLVALARRRGIKTLALVRHDGGITRSLQALGATAVIVDQGQDIVAEAVSLTGGDRVPMAVDAVGGKATTVLAACLDDGGTLVSYGALAGEPCQIPPQDLVFRNLRVVGFWLSRWIAGTPREEVQARYAELLDHIRKDQLRAEVAGTYPLERFREAVRAAETGGRNGKILFTPDNPW
jgi:NADPH:quinone reductase-like Zn-dependent oxidoreductase